MDYQAFLFNRDHTGRFIVYSPLTGITYYVEALDTHNTKQFGDVNPATNKIEGDYGKKYKGSIHPSQSLITSANGFQNIQTLPPGTSPYGAIAEIDQVRYNQGFRPKPERRN